MFSSKDIGLYDERAMMDSVETKLKDIYNIDMGEKKLRLNSVSFGDYNYDPEDWADIKRAKLKRETIGRPYYGDFELINDQGDVIDKRKVKFGVLPVNTAVDNFLVDGNFYSVPVQFRLKPGAYTRETNRGDFEVFHNVKNGVPMRTQIDPGSKKISVNIRQGSVPIYPILKAMGVDDSSISSALGKEIYERNYTRDGDKELSKLNRILFGSSPDSIDQARENVSLYFGGLSTTPEINKKTIGLSSSSVDGDYLLSSSQKLVRVVRGDEDPDNRDDLLYKDVYSVNDIVDDMLERIKKTHRLDWRVKSKINSQDSIQKIVNRNDVNKAIKNIITSSDISRFADQTNPLSNELNHLTTTLLGEGGIASSDLVTMDAKSLQPSHAGFLDPAHTPESGSGGVTLFLSNDTIKDGRKLRTKVIDLSTGEYVWLTPEDFHSEPIAYPGEFVVNDGRWVPDDNDVVCVFDGHNSVKRPREVRYMIASASGLFDLSSNTVPFIQSNQANRLLTSSKMAAQASPLASPEKPLVEVSIDGRGILDVIGDKYSVHAKVSGEVSEITDDYIVVSSAAGKVKHAIPNNIPLNGKAFIDSVPRVSVGENVKKGELIADTNTTIDGKLSTGVNLNVAYLPYRGLNYEDSSVITESAAKRLATEHMHRVHIPKESILDINKYRAYSPYDIKEDDVNRFDERGVIKPGTVIMPNQIMATSLKERTFSAADSLIQRLRKSAVSPFKPDPVIWDRSMSGTVTDVSDVGNGVDIYVKTIEPVMPGDKLVGRHGNKTTVSTIIPDSLAPRTDSGDPIDIILDPLSVPPRINAGQLLETAAGKLARKTGKTYVVENFDGKDHRSIILDEMKNNGISEKDAIIDPSTGKTIPGVFTGTQYIHKLTHQAENKMSARGIDEPYNINQQPTRGKGTGGQSIDNLSMNILLAHNARENLKESFAIKNNPNREYWRAVQHGLIPPAPKIPYEYSKFEAMLKGMGVNTEHIGSTVKLSPLTDKMVRNMSSGAIKEPHKTFRLKGNDIEPDKNGLFGKETGGISGNTFNHIELPTRIAAPAYKDAIKAVLGITDSEYDKLLEE